MLYNTLRWGFGAAVITKTVLGQHPRSHHIGSTSMQTSLEVRVGFKL